MSKIFYDHLIFFEEITAELDNYQISVEERREISSLADETMHHRILNVILKNLPKEKHEAFVRRLHQAPHDRNLLEDLKKDAADIEKKITAEAKKVRKEIIAEIKKAAV